MTVKSTGCGFDPSLVWRRQSGPLSSATQHEMPPESGGKWGTTCLNNRAVCGIQREADLILIFFYLQIFNTTACKVHHYLKYMGFTKNCFY